MRLHGAFTALVLQVCAASSVTVPPPTNVNLNCQNLKTIVSWEYSEDQPNTRFRVDVESSAGKETKETTAHQFDLSDFIWKTVDHYTGFHYVYVTAIQGERRSRPVKSPSLSFNLGKTVDVKCYLDFPPVTLTTDDLGSTVSFPNPLHFYEHLKRAYKEKNLAFEYIISLNTSGDLKTWTGGCRLTEKICKYGIFQGVEECITLNGYLNDGTNVNYVMFREMSHICASDSSEIHMVTLTVLLCIFVLIIILSVVIWKVKTWNLMPEVPDFLKTTFTLWPTYMNPHEEKILIVHICTVGPSCSTEEECGPTGDHECSSAGSDQTMSAYGDGRLLENSSQEMDMVDEDSVETQCVVIEEEEEDEEEREHLRVYDCRHFPEGDITAYMKR